MRLIPFVLLALVAPALGQEAKVDPALAPFLDGQTAAVVRLDLSRLDADAAAAKFAALGKLDPKQLAEPTKTLAAHLQTLRKAGAKDAYFVFTLANDPPHEPAVIVPVHGGDAKAVVEVLRALGNFAEVGQAGPAVVAGSKPAVARLRQVKPAARIDFGRALAAVPNTAVQIAVAPPADLRRAVEEALPTLPRELGGGPSRTLTRGVEWLAVGVDVAPKLTVRGVVQAPDGEGAKALAAAVPAMLQAMARDQAVKAALPEIEKLAAAIKPQVAGERLTFALDESQLAGLAAPLLASAQQAGRALAMNNLRQIGLALHIYHDTHNALPTQANLDKQNQPLLSWRVHLLPYLEQGELYKQFRLDEPWDSEHNKKLVVRMPAIYQGRNVQLNEAGRTRFLAPQTPGAVLRPGAKGMRLTEIANADGTSNTIAVVDADDEKAVPWTKPDDLTVDAKQPLTGLGGRYEGAFLALFMDGSVGEIPRGAAADNVYRLFLYNSGKPKKRP